VFAGRSIECRRKATGGERDARFECAASAPPSLPHSKYSRAMFASVANLRISRSSGVSRLRSNVAIASPVIFHWNPFNTTSFAAAVPVCPVALITIAAVSVSEPTAYRCYYASTR
jgi:hypothetical protein